VVKQRPIGTDLVSAIGFGAMNLSLEGRPSEGEAIRTIHAALDAGVTLIDTADVYCRFPAEFGHNERLVAKALRQWPRSDEVLVATKGGHYLTVTEPYLQDGRPESLMAACEASLRALGRETIDLYQYHSPDPKVPFLDSVGALAELQRQGKVRMVGLSNAGRRQLAEALTIVNVVSMQNQLSPFEQGARQIAAACGGRGIAFLSWSPLGGRLRSGGLPAMGPFAEVARAHAVSAHQVAIAWALTVSPTVIPIPGARRVDSILDSVRGVDLELSSEELRRLDAPPGEVETRI
jgi:aryl-alcohol dehydrogenase-like predicted oxidoreductase